MNANQLIPFGWICLVLTATACSQSGNTADGAADLDALEQIMVRRGWDDPSYIVENYTSVRRNAEFESLRQAMVRDWLAVVENAMQPESTPMRRTLVIVAAQALSPEAYREFLGSLVGFVESGTVTKKEMKWALFPPQPSLVGVWTKTWIEPQTREVIVRLKRIFSEDVNMMTYLNRILSGEAKRHSFWVNMRMSNPMPFLITGMMGIVGTVVAVGLLWWIGRGRGAISIHHRTV